jgi:xanthine dehydrogenase iron-sulfur cluster and FAD-binding subunit A
MRDAAVIFLNGVRRDVRGRDALRMLAGVHERTARPTRKAVANALTGNLCRCTGYSQILDAGCAVEGGGEHALRERYLRPQLVEEAERAIEEPLELEAPPARFIAPTTLRGAVAEAPLAERDARVGVVR